MRRIYRKNQSKSSDSCYDAADLARLFGIVLLLLLLSVKCLASDELLNPLANEFGLDNERIQTPSRPLYPQDKTPIPNGTAEQKKTVKRKIRQASGELPNTSTPSPWDNPQPATDAADWRTPQPAFASQPQPQPPNAVNPYQPNPYPANPYQPNPYLQAPTGYYPADNFYNPYAAQPSYPVPYQPYPAPQVQSFGQFAFNPYGAQNPYDFSGYDPYQVPTESQLSPEQRQTLLKTLMQQELLRHQQSLDDEDGKKTPPETPDKKDTKDEKGKSPLGMENLMPVKISSPLGSTLLSCAKTMSPFCTPEGPHKGVGQPMEMHSWLDHPYYFGGFVGRMSGSDLVSDLIKQKSGGNGGLIFGYNLNDYWGVESRLHFASLDIHETAKGRAAYEAWTAATAVAGSYIAPLTTRSNQISVLDAAVHYYPLGNAKWRPFFKYGLGWARESFTDTFGRKVHINTVAMPVGAGMRYWWNENLAIQMDLVDNVIFSAKGTKTQGNFSFAVGLTYSFGSSNTKRPTVYWPYVNR